MGANMRVARGAMLFISLMMFAGSGHAAMKPTQFEYSKFPTSTSEKSNVLSSSWATIGGELQDLAYRTIARSGDQIGDKIFGQTRTHDGAAVAGSNTASDADGSGRPEIDYMISDYEDFTR